ncbi:hypothetical protein LTR84_007825 [Exophiala bonariae]|uniref:NADAR domain-containing protein n=1 Tax=Exophiala bonariae TaxID=1690606 RepID=A0AAV9NM57_9EURO|nr:hypothetical protein LTR84_007825 [Exophiala bonariae]
MSAGGVNNQDSKLRSASDDVDNDRETTTTRRYPRRNRKEVLTTSNKTSTASVSIIHKASHKRKAVSPKPPGSKSELGTMDSSFKEERQVKTSRKAPRKQSGSDRGIRITDKHILFWGSVLSNWNLGSTFPGSRLVELLIPRLVEHGVEHPRRTSVSTKLLEHHNFVCGEQAMMACKAWLFEKGPVLEQDVEELQLTDPSSFFDVFQDPAAFSDVSLPRNLGSASDLLAKARKTYLWQILLNSSPRHQKGLGRKIPNFSPDIWSTSCVPIVVSVCIARAECEDELKKLYRHVGDRKFVEGSPMDRIWGVGLRWDNPLADAEENWKGTNLLGKCHDQAAAFSNTGDF